VAIPLRKVEIAALRSQRQRGCHCEGRSPVAISSLSRSPSTT